MSIINIEKYIQGLIEATIDNRMTIRPIRLIKEILTLQVSNPQNGQTHSNNSPAVAGKLFESVWSFCGVGTSRKNNK